MGILDLFGVGDVAKLVNKILDYFPDATQRAEAQKHLEDLVAAAQAQQVDVNKIEAASNSLFLAGWRPFVAWNCGVLFCLNMWLPLFGLHATFDSATANNTLYLLLGLGTWRTADKLGGVATEAIKKIFRK